MTYRVFLTPTAQRLLDGVSDRRIRQQIRDRINGLVQDPEQQGKPLQGECLGYHSLRAVGQRYRVIYRVDRGRVIVIIVAVGLRKEGDRQDVYRLAEKLIRLRLV